MTASATSEARAPWLCRVFGHKHSSDISAGAPCERAGCPASASESQLNAAVGAILKSSEALIGVHALLKQHGMPDDVHSYTWLDQRLALLAQFEAAAQHPAHRDA